MALGRCLLATFNLDPSWVTRSLLLMIVHSLATCSRRSWSVGDRSQTGLYDLRAVPVRGRNLLQELDQRDSHLRTSSGFVRQVRLPETPSDLALHKVGKLRVDEMIQPLGVPVWSRFRAFGAFNLL